MALNSDSLYEKIQLYQEDGYEQVTSVYLSVVRRISRLISWPRRAFYAPLRFSRPQFATNMEDGEAPAFLARSRSRRSCIYRCHPAIVFFIGLMTGAALLFKFGGGEASNAMRLSVTPIADIETLDTYFDPTDDVYSDTPVFEFGQHDIHLNSFPPDIIPPEQHPSPITDPQLATLPDVYNRTLGFEKVFAVGFEDRTDKRDALTMAGAITDIDITFMPGVRADTVPDVARPNGWESDWAGDGAIGCWRAHMNVIQRVVRERISTALILEDDADWDTSVKEQLATFAKGALAIRNATGQHTMSPYGDDWDVLWLGACKISEPRFDSRMYVIANDSTVPPPNHLNARWNFHRPSIVDVPQTRLVFTPGQGACTTAFAVSQRGARRMLSSLSLRPWQRAIDRKLSRMCGQFPGEPPFHCIAVFPPYFGMHRFAGSTDRDSDIHVPETARWHEEYTQDVVYSVTQNVPALVAGETTVKAQWADVAETEIERDRAWGFEGEVQIVDVGEHPYDEECVFCPG